jgi:hypothetical protein
LKTVQCILSFSILELFIAALALIAFRAAASVFLEEIVFWLLTRTALAPGE